MSEIHIYTSPLCPYCDRAKSLLKSKNVTFTEFNIAKDAQARDYMIALSGGRQTVPQIFIKGQHIGGCNDLYDLDKSGKLDPLLSELN